MTRWYLGGIAAAIAIAWLAAQVQLTGHAPLGIVSLGVGLALGATLVALGSLADVCCRKRLILGTLLFSILTVATQHAWMYRDFHRQWHAAQTANPQVAMFRPGEPWSPREYFAREATASRIALWTVDAAAIVATATSMIVLWQRRKSPTSDP
jgi:hypothetical protein